MSGREAGAFPQESRGSTTVSAVTATEQRRSLNALTGLRGLAALHVVLYHYLSPLGGSSLMNALEAVRVCGDQAVTLFFVLSGFILVYAERGQDGRLGSWKAFYVRRLARIAPCYVLALVLAAPFVISSGQPASVIASSFLLTLTTLQTWVPGDPFGVWNYPAYTIGIEVTFYLVFPLLLPWVMGLRRRSVVYALFAAYALACAGDALFCVGGNVFPEYPHALPPYRMPVFFVGMLLGRIFVKDEVVLSERRASLLMSSAIAAILLTYVYFADALPQVRQTIVPFFGLLIFAGAFDAGFLARVLASRVAVGLGEISYGVYILQAPVSSWVAGSAGVRGRPAWFVLLYVAVLIATSYLSYRWIEEPVRRWVRSRTSRGRTRPGETQPVAGLAH